MIFEKVHNWYQINVRKRTWIGQVLRKMRRFYMGNFQPERIQQSIKETRSGECHRCGLCCELVYKCAFLGRDGQNLPYCRVYGDLRPANCHNYPYDVVDAEIDQCGYTFKNTDKV